MRPSYLKNDGIRTGQSQLAVQPLIVLNDRSITRPEIIVRILEGVDGF
jgi:hypothetical protein